MIKTGKYTIEFDIKCAHAASHSDKNASFAFGLAIINTTIINNNNNNKNDNKQTKPKKAIDDNNINNSTSDEVFEFLCVHGDCLNRMWTIKQCKSNDKFNNNNNNNNRSIILATHNDINLRPNSWINITIEVANSNTLSLVCDKQRMIFHHLTLTTMVPLTGPFLMAASMSKQFWKNVIITKGGASTIDNKTSTPTITTSTSINEDPFLIDLIERDIIIKSPGVTFEDIASLDDAKRVLDEAVRLPLIIPDFFIGIREPWQGVLLFGPPGTGKTLLGKLM